MSETVSPDNAYADTKTDKPWLFKAGQPSANPLGRPRKGETIAEKVARADAKIASQAIRARNKRLRLENAVGAREWSTYLAYNLGMPTQKFVIESGASDAAVDALLTRLAYVGEPQALPYVEGESRELPSG